MKHILLLKEQIAEVNCDKELGWLQLRLLVLNLLNTMVPLTYEKKKISLSQIQDLQSLYRQYLQVPFSQMTDLTLCLSVKNEVILQLDALEQQLSAAAA